MQETAGSGTRRAPANDADRAPESVNTQLAEHALRLLHCHTKAEVLHVVGDFVSLAAPGAIVVVNEGSPDGDFLVTRAIAGIDGSALAKAADLLGFEIVGRRWAISPTYRDAVLGGELVRISDGLAEFASSGMSRAAAEMLAKGFGVQEVFTIGIADGVSALGSLLVLTRDTGSVLPSLRIESFARHAYSALARLQQIEERIQTEVDLRSAKAEWERTFDAIQDPIAILDDEFHIERVNDAMASKLGMPASECVGARCYELVHATDCPPEACPNRRLLEDGASHQAELLEDRLGGHFLVGVSPLIDADGTVSGCVHVAHDITQRRRIEEEVRQSEAKFSTAFSASPDLMSITRVSDGTIIELNDGYTRLLGYTPAESIGKTTTELSIWADPADRDRFTSLLAASGEVRNLETTLRRKDGSTFPVIDSARLVDLEGESCVVSVVHDITELKEAESALRQSEERFRSIVTSMEEGVILYDDGGRVLFVNPAAERILGVPGEGLIGQTPKDRVADSGMVREDGSPMKAAEHPVIVALATGEPTFNTVVGVHRPDGSLAWVSANAMAIVAEGESQPHAAVTTFHDVTDKLAAANELERRQAELEALLEQRDSSLALAQKAFASTIDVIGALAELRDPYTAGHQRRVAELAVRIASAMGASAEDVEQIRIASLIHDVGKIAVPAEILSKPGALSDVERALIKGHAEAGYGVIASGGMVGDTAEIVRQHHERCDGSGYPRGLSADKLLPAAKVLMVADVVEAMVSHRPYRPGLGIDAALAEIESGAGTLYDPEVSRACQRVFREEAFEFTQE